MHVHERNINKYCSTTTYKCWKHPFYNALKEKRKHKNDEKKEEEDKRFLKGSRTVKNGYKSSVYKALRRNENKKEEEYIWQQHPTMFQDLPVHGTMPSDQHKHWVSASHTHFCTQPLTLKECL